MGQINEVLILLTQGFNYVGISLQLSGPVLHWVQNEHSFRDIIVFVGGEPIGENCIGSPIIIMCELVNFYAC
jgi:hypothetical protein